MIPEADPAETVRSFWNQLARTPWRNFFVASHAGWNQEEAWQGQAAVDVTNFLAGLGRRWLAEQHVLEIGCGVGRLSPLVASVSKSYTGFDISEAMLEQARVACAGVPNARLFLGSGSAVPAEARDRRYGVVVAIAVFIHCPLELVASNIRSAWPLVAPGGTFRFQLRADCSDPARRVCDPALMRVAVDPEDEALPLAPAPAEPDYRHSVPQAALALTQNREYGGHPFRVDELAALLPSWAPGAEVAIHRPEPELLYALLRRPAS